MRYVVSDHHRGNRSRSIVFGGTVIKFLHSSIKYFYTVVSNKVARKVGDSETAWMTDSDSNSLDGIESFGKRRKRTFFIPPEIDGRHSISSTKRHHIPNATIYQNTVNIILYYCLLILYWFNPGRCRTSYCHRCQYSHHAPFRR